MEEYFSEKNKEQLKTNLHRLITEGSEDSFLIVSVGDIYVQFVPPSEEKEIYCEAVSNEFLPRRMKLDEKRTSRLKELGFEEPGESPNYSRYFDISNDNALQEAIQTILSIFANVYGCPANSNFKFELNLE